jgi:hypothetical protein
VLFEAPRREITAVAVAANGTIYAASVGDKSHNPLPPLPVQGVGSITITIVQPGSLQAANTSASVPEGSEIYALALERVRRRASSGPARTRSSTRWPRADGLLALTGNRGRVFRIAGRRQLRRHRPPGGAAGAESGRARRGRHGRHSHRHRQHRQAGLPGRGRQARVRQRRAGCGRAGPLWPRRGRARLGGYELLTRTGNVEQPVRGWSDWQPLKDGAVASPAGRFLQWKAVLRRAWKAGQRGRQLPARERRSGGGRDLVVVPGARSIAQNQPARSQPPTVNIAFPLVQPERGMSFDAPAPPLAGLQGPHRHHRPLGGARRQRRRPDLTRSICAATAKPFGGCSRLRSPTRLTASTPR